VTGINLFMYVHSYSPETESITY